MSVHGELQRILGDLVAFLERTGAPESGRWIRELEEAAAAARRNLADGATRVLDLLEGEGPAPRFISPLEIEEFARIQEHLVSLCGVILGR